MYPEDMPTLKQIKRMDELRIPYDIDKPLRDVVIELNEVGLVTGGSCCGHGSPNNSAFINFEEILTEKDKDKASTILSKNGVRIIKFDTVRALDNPKEPLRTVVDIENISTPKPDYREPWKAWDIEREIWERAEKEADKKLSVNEVLSKYKEIDGSYINQAKKAIAEKDAKTLNVIREGVEGRLGRYDKYYKQKRSLVIGKKDTWKKAGVFGKRLRNKACAIKLIECNSG